jgi:dTDP-glucose 4,6-dehydratase
MNNVGERQHPEKFVPLVISNIIKGETIPVHARPEEDGSWTPGSRVWLHARNHADALKFLLENVDVPAYGEGEMPVFNVAGEEEINNYEMVEFIAEVLGMPAEARYVDYHSSRPGHDLRYSLDGSKLRNLGWEPPVPLRESLKRTVIWYQENPDWLNV